MDTLFMLMKQFDGPYKPIARVSCKTIPMPSKNKDYGALIKCVRQALSRYKPMFDFPVHLAMTAITHG